MATVDLVLALNATILIDVRNSNTHMVKRSLSNILNISKLNLSLK